MKEVNNMDVNAKILISAAVVASIPVLLFIIIMGIM